MSGTGNDIIFIVIVPVICLAFMLGMIYHSASHPEWRNQMDDRRDAIAAQRGRQPLPPP
jgi:hypothetical protein